MAVLADAQQDQVEGGRRVPESVDNHVTIRRSGFYGLDLATHAVDLLRRYDLIVSSVASPAGTITQIARGGSR